MGREGGGAGSEGEGEGEGDEKRAFPNGMLPPSKRPFAPSAAGRPFAPCAERPFAGFGRRGAGEIDGASPKSPGLSTAVATAEEASPNKAEVDGVEEGHGEGEGGG